MRISDDLAQCLREFITQDATGIIFIHGTDILGDQNRCRDGFEAVDLARIDFNKGCHQPPQAVHDALGSLVTRAAQLEHGLLSLDRSADTLSGGEAQRIRLASQLGSELSGVMYVLDEPSIGLHQRDNRRLINTLQRLRDQGNSVLVVEHDAETVLSADWVVDFGPGAGRYGGQVVFSGTPSQLLRDERSLTGAGMVVVKFWLHVSKGEQLKRFEERQADPGRRYKITPEDWRNREKWDLYHRAVHDLVTQTSTASAPWTLVEAEDKLWARIRCLKTVVEAIERRLK